MKKSIIIILLFFPSLSFGLTNISSLPFTCDIPGETYVLTKNLSTEGTAIFIKASNISINLNGYTITFGTGGGTSDGIQLKNVWGIKNVRIFNGKIVHGGANNPPNCNGIAFYNAVAGAVIHDIGITVKSRSDSNGQSCGLLLKWASNVEIFNCNIDNQASDVINRHSLPAGGIFVHLSDDSTSCKIHNNIVKSTHQGISLLTSTSWKSSGNKVYSNSVAINQCGSTNGYALFFYRINGLEVYSNVVNNITERGGRGLMLNTISNFDVHHNTISTREGKTNESFQTNGIRIRWGCKYGKVYNNKIDVYAGQTSAFGDAYGIYVTEDKGNPLGTDVQIYENTINAMTFDINKKAYGIYIEFMEPGLRYIFRDNNIYTNSRAIRLDSGWNAPYPSQDIKFDRIKISKVSGNVSNYLSYELNGKLGEIKDIFMIDTVYSNGANEDDIIFGDDLSAGELTHISTSKFLVNDSTGLPVQGATVKLTNSLGEQIGSGTTNSKGEFIFEIPYKKQLKTEGKINYNPFILSATYDCRVGSKQITVSNTTKEFTITLPSEKSSKCAGNIIQIVPPTIIASPIPEPAPEPGPVVSETTTPRTQTTVTTSAPAREPAPSDTPSSQPISSSTSSALPEPASTSSSTPAPTPAPSSSSSPEPATQGQVFVAVSEITSDGEAIGNVKKYELTNGTNVNATNDANANTTNNTNTSTGVQVVDATQTPVIDSNHQIKESSTSAWSSSSDGQKVDKGGVGEVLLKRSKPRKLLTNIETTSSTYATNELHEFTTFNEKITPEMLGLSSEDKTEREKLIQYVHGFDVFPRENKGTSFQKRKWLLGAIVNSRPLVIPYENSKRVIFVGANDGMLHAFDARSGEELWGFIPYELLGRLKELPQGKGLKYFVDGSPKAYLTKSQKIIVFGLRRGGNHYYALDVTSPENPKFLWKIGPDTAGFSEMGQTWSEPQFGRIRLGTGAKAVCIIGGGYDENQDRKTPASEDRKGRAVYVVDLLTGQQIWRWDSKKDPNMKHSIPSTVARVDINGDGYIDRLYVGDMGGRLWRFDLKGPDPSFWSGRIVFNSNLGFASSDKKKIFSKPDVTLEKGYQIVFFGTGNREHLNEKIGVDKFYAIMDKGSNSVLSENNLADVTKDFATSQTLAGKEGWFISLEAGEKVMAPPVVAFGVVYFSTYTPSPDGEGIARLYALNYRTGNPIFNLNAENDLRGPVIDLSDRSRIIGTGIPSGTVISALGKRPFAYTGVSGGLFATPLLGHSTIIPISWREVNNKK